MHGVLNLLRTAVGTIKYYMTITQSVVLGYSDKQCGGRARGRDGAHMGRLEEDETDERAVSAGQRRSSRRAGESERDQAGERERRERKEREPLS